MRPDFSKIILKKTDGKKSFSMTGDNKTWTTGENIELKSLYTKEDIVCYNNHYSMVIILGGI